MWVQSLSQGRPLEKKWQPAPVFLSEKSHAEEPGELQSIGSQKGGHRATKHTKEAGIPIVPAHFISVVHHDLEEYPSKNLVVLFYFWGCF